MKSIHKISIIGLVHILSLFSLASGILAGFIVLSLLAGFISYRFLKEGGFNSKFDHPFAILGIGCGILAYLGLGPGASFLGLYGFGVFAGLFITNVFSRKFNK